MLQVAVKPETHFAHWHSQRPVMAVMGEYSAGKSTLLNYLLAQNIFTTRITATNFPPIWLTFSEEPHALAVNADGAIHSFDLADLADFGGSTYTVLRLALPIAFLRDIDVIDTPGISDVRLAKKSLRVFAPFLDTVMWCSNASQAWRQTEISMWKSFPETLHKHSLLVLTQSDKLHDPRDIEKVMKRVARETKPFFRQSLAVSTNAAIKARGRTDEVENHDIGSMAELRTALAGVIAIAKQACSERPDIAAPLAAIVPAPASTYFNNARTKEDNAVTTRDTIQQQKLNKEYNMANVDISKLAEIGGFIGACLVDSETGLMMASEGGGKLDLEAAGAANTEVVKAKLSAIEMLGLDDHIDDILITLGKQFHLIRPLEKSPKVFLYVALDKKGANLGMARVQVKSVEKDLSL